MKNHSVVLILSNLLAASVLSAQSATSLAIDLSRPKSPVSPTLYGLMTEEINYSYDGGLYAELVRNRDFPLRLVGDPELVPDRKRDGARQK